MTLSAGRICAIVACALFLLVVFSVSLGSVQLLPLGLAFLAAAHFVN